VAYTRFYGCRTYEAAVSRRRPKAAILRRLGRAAQPNTDICGCFFPPDSLNFCGCCAALGPLRRSLPLAHRLTLLNVVIYSCRIHSFTSNHHVLKALVNTKTAVIDFASWVLGPSYTIRTLLSFPPDSRLSSPCVATSELMI
jgi:hypothetical protein